jgi:glycopeptide antibiotics resistance protein
MNKQLVSVVFLIAYSVLLMKLLVYKQVFLKIGHLMFNFSGTATGPANFVPLRTILPYLNGEKGSIIALFELAGNIVLLIPIGFILPFLNASMAWKKVILIAVLTGVFIEGLQVLLRVGIFDIDDVLLNALGVVIGYGIVRIVKK